MKTVIIFVACIVSSMAQRPSYAGNRAVGYPGLASRFKNTSTTANTDTSSTSNAPDLGTRLGVANSGPVQGPSQNNDDFIDYSKVFQGWPRENLPYWYVNSEQIRKTLAANARTNQVNTNFQRPSATVQNRISSDLNNRNAFTTSINGQAKTYVYDPSTDAWVSSKV